MDRCTGRTSDGTNEVVGEEHLCLGLRHVREEPPEKIAGVDETAAIALENLGSNNVQPLITEGADQGSLVHADEVARGL